MLDEVKNKEQILSLDWKHNDIGQAIGKKDLVIITNGTKSFVERQNKRIKEGLGVAPIEVIDCYCFDEVKDEMIKIRGGYAAVINNLQK